MRALITLAVGAAAFTAIAPAAAPKQKKPDTASEFGDELDAAAGRRFRECVLEPGAAAGGAAMMEAFLGRPFREDAYFERLGVPVSS